MQRKIPDKQLLEKALAAIQTKKMSLRKASKKFGIPKSTTSDYKNQKYAQTSLNHNQLLSDVEEVLVANYLKWMASQALPVTRKVL